MSKVFFDLVLIVVGLCCLDKALAVVCMIFCALDALTPRITVVYRVSLVSISTLGNSSCEGVSISLCLIGVCDRVVSALSSRLYKLLGVVNDTLGIVRLAFSRQVVIELAEPCLPVVLRRKQFFFIL